MRTCTGDMLIAAGFSGEHNFYKIHKVLYKYNNTKLPYVTLDIIVNTDNLDLMMRVRDDSGNVYAPFYNPDMRHNNLVYEKIVTEYHNFMEKLVDKKILKYEKADRK